MNLPIKAKYKWTSAEVAAAARTSIKYGVVGWVRYAAIFFILIFLVSLFFDKAIIASTASLLPLALIFLFIGDISVWVTLYKFRSNPYKGSEICWSFSEENFSSEGDGFSHTGVWKKVYKFLDTPKGFLMYPQKSLIYWIPFSAFENAADIATVREIVKSKVLKYQKRGGAGPIR